MSQIADLQGRLASIGEDLTDLAMDRLREAIDAGADKAPASEKKLTQARRAIEKAIMLLEQVSDHDSSDQ